MKRCLVAFSALIALSGCVQPQQRLSDSDMCSTYGFETKSADYGNCMMQFEMQRRQVVGQLLVQQWRR